MHELISQKKIMRITQSQPAGIPRCLINLVWFQRTFTNKPGQVLCNVCFLCQGRYIFLCIQGTLKNVK